MKSQISTDLPEVVTTPVATAIASKTDSGIPDADEGYWRIPTRSLPLLAILLGVGAIVLLFTLATVHSLNPQELVTRPEAVRTRFSIIYWLDHGYFRSFGMLVRPQATTPGFHYYKSSTGAHLIPGFLVEKLHVWVTGRPSWRLLALHNQISTLFIAVVLGLLGFRLAQRLGAHPLHALAMSISVEVVHFTFPDNLALYFEMNGRPYCLFFALVFLLVEERSIERRTSSGTIAQAVAAFLLVYMEYIAGMAFIVSFVIVTLLTHNVMPLKRLARTAIIPGLLALSVFGIQRILVRASHVPADGSGFLFRTGLDGSSQYYGDHLDIAYGRDVARINFPHNRANLFRWKWLFLSGTGALLGVLILAMLGRVATIATVSLMSLLGTYLLYAALFSQAVMIHPYLFDVLLVTPLILGLFVLAPSLLESLTGQRGVAVAVVVFVAVWVSMMQLRRYAMQYPRPTEVSGWDARSAGPRIPAREGIHRASPSLEGRRLLVRATKRETAPLSLAIGLQ